MTLQEQAIAVHQNWDNWRGKIEYRRILILEGEVRPTAVSPLYKVRISFEIGKNPFVKILSPELKLYPGKTSLPHVFSNPGSPLCLFQHDFNNTEDLLADTIIKWITWWLAFYEIWAETGDWTGGGTHPDRW
ncbi:hypothetical protein [Draconibacterium orientale]|uniref:hypothetical protein n=1 Tax=Draconibacterium orientale TaxID=1168034 RepID=UPI0029C09254|nr:hypothetical protein [Draconibacterium orientale]